MNEALTATVDERQHCYNNHYRNQCKSNEYASFVAHAGENWTWKLKKKTKKKLLHAIGLRITLAFLSLFILFNLLFTRESVIDDPLFHEKKTT